MAQTLSADICVIGGGSGGLSVAAGAAMLGARTILIERGKMGGDCLNYGCVPSKSLIAAGHAAEAVRRAPRFGVDAGAPRVEFRRVRDYVQGVIAEIAPQDSVERFEGLGVRVIPAAARFVGPSAVAAGEFTITARRFVVATGSAPAIPPIPGLDSVPFETNETIFARDSAPAHLIVIGGGPIGLELAQAHRHLGAAVTVIEMFSALGRDDGELAEIVKTALRRDGVALHEKVKVINVARDGAGIAVTIEAAGVAQKISGSHLLVAAGRRPNVGGLDLEKAGIVYSPKGINVDRRLRTSNARVFAIGDAAGGYQFTHVAAYHAGIVIRNALFRLPAKVDYRAVPRVTFTTPELAQVGQTEDEARTAHGDIRVLRWPFAENDRAHTESLVEGLVKVVTTARGTIVGAGIVGAHAGELIQSWILPIAKRMKIKDMAGLILPYPTLGEANKRAAGAYFLPALFSLRTRRLVRLLARLG